MKLLDKQFLFTRNVARLIREAYNIDGVTLTFGRASVSEAANKADKGIKDSTHTMRLAIDLNLFVDREYITGNHPVWHSLGRFWKSLNRDEHRWGGDFYRKKDYNHFSIRHAGKQ